MFSSSGIVQVIPVSQLADRNSRSPFGLVMVDSMGWACLVEVSLGTTIPMGITVSE